VEFSSGDQSGEKEPQQPQPKPTLSADGSIPLGDAAVESPAEGANTTINDPDAVEPERPNNGPAKLKMPAAAADEQPAAGARHPPLPPPRHPRPVRSTEQRALSDLTTASSLGDVNVGGVGASKGKSVKVAEEEREFAPDGTPYVGDGTWEERTWKELTRLREDMFWARVGSAQ
jgi:hypothetical protein